MNNIILEKSFDFSVESSKYYKKYLKKHGFIILNQFLRSATSIGANIREAQFAQSKKDFISKMSIALKEASETEYWLKILKSIDEEDSEELTFLLNKCIEINKILISILKKISTP